MVRVFTNSVSDLSLDLAEKYGVNLIADTIIFDKQEMLNNIDINPEKFYKMLESSSKLPTSAHPNIYQYMEAFKTINEGDDVLCITITSKMSGSVSTANIAKKELLEQGFKGNIEIYDSLQVSHGLAILAIKAAILAKEGKTIDEIVPVLENLRNNLGVYFAMPSLENARKGGRIGVVKCFAADAMGIKPILAFTDGTVKDLGLVRGFKSAKEKVFKRFCEEVDYSEEIVVFHADAYSEAKAMQERILAVNPNATIRIEWVGAVIGIYTGKGALGVAFIKKTDKS